MHESHLNWVNLYSILSQSFISCMISSGTLLYSNSENVNDSVHKTTTLMMLIVIPAAIGIIGVAVTLSQVQLAALEVLMDAGFIKQPAAPRRLGRLLCKPCSTCSTGQRNISGSIYFNRPNDTSISLKRNVQVKLFPLERKTLRLK